MTPLNDYRVKMSLPRAALRLLIARDDNKTQRLLGLVFGGCVLALLPSMAVSFWARDSSKLEGSSYVKGNLIK